MRYSIDLQKFMIQDYRELLRHQNLLPGRRILLENIDVHFSALIREGLNDVQALKNALSTPIKLKSLSDKTGISEDYLVILRRELGTLEQKPVLLKDFPEISIDQINALSEQGIKTSKDYFDRDYPYSAQISEEDTLLDLCDLVRINGVGALAARTFWEAGYKSVAEVAGADAATLLQKVNQVNALKHYYKANLGVKDMQFCIDFAKVLMRFQT